MEADSKDTEINGEESNIKTLNSEAYSILKNIYSDIDGKIRYKEFEKSALLRLKHDIETFNEACVNQLNNQNTNLKQIAHDLKNYIGALLPLTDTLKEEYANSNTTITSSNKSEISECINCLRNGFDKAVILIEEILPKKKYFNSDIKSKNSLKLEKVNIRETINQIKLINSYELNKYNIVFDVDASGLSSDYIVTNKLHLNRILSNLISNAIKFCDKDKGNIIIGLEKELSCNPTSNKLEEYIIISVFNNTKSVNDNNNYKSDFEANKGHGMGLDIVKQLVGELDGEIKINNSFSTGFEVSVKLPMKNETELKITYEDL